MQTLVLATRALSATVLGPGNTSAEIQRYSTELLRAILRIWHNVNIKVRLFDSLSRRLT